jgi:UDP-N-acetylmuramyl tripeptide synthase
VNYRLLLVKNPASFSLSLELMRNIPHLKLMLAINDNTADGRDVSWLWDSELERLNQADIDWVLCTGIRAKDMAVRLKYALDNPARPILLRNRFTRPLIYPLNRPTPAIRCLCCRPIPPCSNFAS